jgi:hypothetical protein
VSKDFVREFEFPDGDARKHGVRVVHAYPELTEWLGRYLPDKVNPRSHEEECLKSPVAHEIRATLTDAPEDFYLANRGGTILAESYEYDPKKGIMTLVIADPDNQGLADGATTDAVIGKMQRDIAGEGREFRDVKWEEIPDSLKRARLHIEIVTGLNDRDRIGRMVAGRNTSRQVRAWSLSDFQGRFDWIKDILEDSDSGFAGKVGYEENSGKEVTVLDVISIATLFHHEYDERTDGKIKAPTVAYSGKGRMDARLKDEELLKGYTRLSPILLDILKLHDHVYVNFEKAYDAVYGPKAKLGRRNGIESRKTGNPYKMPLTGKESNYIIPSGLIFPLLAALRALVGYHRNGKAFWRANPFQFFEKFGGDLVAVLIEQVEFVGGNPNSAGKKAPIYKAVHTQARLLLQDFETSENQPAKERKGELVVA